jgi:hypothetical protein
LRIQLPGSPPVKKSFTFVTFCITLATHFNRSIFDQRQTAGTGENRMTDSDADPREFKVLDGAFAIFRNEPVKIVPILSISLDGMVVSDGSSDPWPGDIGELEIMADDCSFYMEKLAVEQIYSADSLDAERRSDHPRYRIRFGRISEDQREGLRYFIRHHTEGGTTPLLFSNLHKFFSSLVSDKYSRTSCPYDPKGPHYSNM